MGCFAMSDDRIEEIYALVHAALAGGQETIPVHIFPFPLTSANMDKYRNSPWFEFWSNLKQGYDLFEETGQVPQIQVAGGRYLVTCRGQEEDTQPAGRRYAASSGRALFPGPESVEIFKIDGPAVHPDQSLLGHPGKNP